MSKDEGKDPEFVDVRILGVDKAGFVAETPDGVTHIVPASRVKKMDFSAIPAPSLQKIRDLYERPPLPREERLRLALEKLMTLKLTICKASEVVDLVRTHERRRQPFDAVISIEHPCDESVSVEEGRAPRLATVVGPHWEERQLILTCYDVEEPNGDIPAPERSLVEQALAHYEQYKNPDLTRVLVHCRSGKARSAALGLILLRYKHGPGSEEEVLQRLLKTRPIAAPNIAIVRHGDDILGCNGALLRAVENDPGVTLRRAEANKARAHQIESRRAARATLAQP